MSQSSFPARTRKRPCKSCDNCRQRKVRCDGPTMLDSHCSSCLASGEPCTYIHPPGKPGPRNKLVQELKQRIETLEARLRSLSVCSLCSQPLQSTLGTSASETPKTDATPTEESQDVEEDPSEELTSQFRQWQLSLVAKSSPKFFGSASHINLVQNAIVIKQEYLGRQLKPNLGLRRPIFWTQFPWEKELYMLQKPYIYPAGDLIDSLIELYFANVHPIFPVLHRNSFQQHVAEGLHLTDSNFGAVLLAVLAAGSRYSDDPRVMIAGNPHSSGWTFVAQLPIVPNVSEPSVYDVQFFCLMTIFSLSGSTPHIIWVYLGLCVRVIQYHGPSLRRRDGHKFEDELWNRAFWSVFVLDVILSSYLGRPPAIQLEEFEVDPPLEVDDEYWETGFAQPADKPATLSFFVHFVRLFAILGKALRWLYASKRQKTRMGLTTEREMETVVELDSLMNDFLDSIPSHLRWESTGHGVFFSQAALLHVTYYWIRLTVHRPYMQTKTPLAGTSLFMCVTAARSALSVADVWTTQIPTIPPVFLQHSLFISAVILLVNIFATKRAGMPLDVEKDLAQVQTAINVFRVCETRAQGTGRLCDLLVDLQSMDGYLSQRFPSKTDAQDDSGAQEHTSQNPSLNPRSLVGQFVSHDQPGFRPGVSIEQLLSDTQQHSSATSTPGNPDSLDTELMSLWLATPADLMNIDQWDAYIDSMAVTDLDWSDRS
ncbi:fungal-specific transcription factor domain-containing protein [Roridomyces roridus]|uniref:Fungal-specific transcription factor domain-containing protein n=1 Tax=Roridomyces roridus TaxID=1738132 RepID=A0AAD7CKC3_9AGAR|nr:fungal-specific transcription factor domain-containing protein [Roridomyces roridus]